MSVDLVIENLTVDYRMAGEVVRVLNGLSASASEGELVLLLGPSGSGKTTLLSCLAGLQTPTAGRITVGPTDVTSLRGAELTRYRQHIVGTAFQSFNLVRSLTAAENVAAPLWAAGVGRRAAAVRAHELLEEVGLGHRARHRPGELSGGQQQRVAIARALALDPPLLLADEPTGHLDYDQAEVVLRILREKAAPGRLVVVSTHDARLLPLGDRVIDLLPATAADTPPPTSTLTLNAGETLFEERDPADFVYMVEQGEVELVRLDDTGAEVEVAVIGPGAYFGELGPMLGFPRTATARARTPAVLRPLSVSEFRSKVR